MQSLNFKRLVHFWKTPKRIACKKVAKNKNFKMVLCSHNLRIGLFGNRILVQITNANGRPTLTGPLGELYQKVLFSKGQRSAWNQSDALIKASMKWLQIIWFAFNHLVFVPCPCPSNCSVSLMPTLMDRSAADRERASTGNSSWRYMLRNNLLDLMWVKRPLGSGDDQIEETSVIELSA